MARATVTSKGQITIPKEIRDRLGLNPGDGLEFTVDDEENLVGSPIRRSPAADLAGCLGHLAGPAPVSLAEMDDAIRRAAAERDLRSRAKGRIRTLALGDGGVGADGKGSDVEPAE